MTESSTKQQNAISQADGDVVAPQQDQTTNQIITENNNNLRPQQVKQQQPQEVSLLSPVAAAAAMVNSPPAAAAVDTAELTHLLSPELSADQPDQKLTQHQHQLQEKSTEKLQKPQNLEISGQCHTVIECGAAAAANLAADHETNLPKSQQLISDSQQQSTQQQNHHQLQDNLDKQEQQPPEVGSASKEEEDRHHHHQQQQQDNKCSGSSRQLASSSAIPLITTSTKYHHHQPTQVHVQDSSSSSSRQPPYCKRRRLSYLQSLLLRRWPCLALAICIMSSLLFGMLLSALTVYLMHGVTDCSGLALAETRRSSSALGHSLNSAAVEMVARRPPAEFDSGPLELASLTGAGGGGELGGSLGGRGQFAALSAAMPTGSAAAPESRRFQRLPSSLWPLHYDLFVQPFIAEPFNFTGKVSILMRCAEATDKITLHTLDLELDESTLSLRRVSNTSSSSSDKATAPAIKGLSQDKQLQYSIVQLAEPLEVGAEYALGIDFRGNLNDDLAGFYKIRYERQNSSETTWIAATQFQATDARRAFPCFDEPLYKATFSIQIKHWKNMTALSNMPIIDRQDSPDGLWVTDTFSKSQRMSTYLVAYAVTNFESRSEGNISVWTRPGFVQTADYALKIAGKILRHYEHFFGIEYPLPKMDMIALPDFNAGAMENWGLITYRETAMLYDENSSSVTNKQRVATVVAHELAHQWFGNLVTPKWWDDLWLNEGFASFVEYIGVDHVEPKWRMLDQFVVEEVQNVFKMDALSSSHQISIPVNNPDEISEIFDHISYAKGASIIRMMSHFLTEDVFKSGLRHYLRALRYNNAEQSDLWAHLTEASAATVRDNSTSGLATQNQKRIDVGNVMNSWTLQTGFPLVTLTRQYDGSRQAHLEQARYQPYKSRTACAGSNGNKTSDLTKASTQEQRWEIPITFTWKSEQNWQPNTRLWMHQNATAPVELQKEQVPQADDEWMLLNVNQVGYYRVNYDKRNWRLLIDQLNSNHSKISATNRAQILDDIFELARSGVMDYGFAMEATKYLREERDYLPWDTVLMSFAYIDDMLQRSPIYGDWKDYIADLTAPYYDRFKNIEWTISKEKPSASNRLQANRTITHLVEVVDKNDVLEHYNLVNAIAWACQVDDHCIQKAKSVFAEWRRSGKNEISPALRYTTYCTAIENGNKEDWDFLWQAYEREQNASERDRIMRALGCSKEIWILARYLEWTFSKSKQIRRQDGAYVFRMIAKNNYGRDIAFNFMRERWQTIKEYYGKSSFSLGNLIRSVSTSMNTQVELNQLMAFYENIKGDVGTGKRAFQIAIEEVESNVLWRNCNYKIIEDWIQEARGEMKPAAAKP